MLSVDTLYIYIRRVRCGEQVPGNIGSPRKLDEKSLKALKELVDENPTIAEKPLRAKIRKEYRISQARKLTFDVAHRVKPLSLPAVKRYSKKLRESDI
jgi:hypothetical protein